MCMLSTFGDFELESEELPAAAVNSLTVPNYSPRCVYDSSVWTE